MFKKIISYIKKSPHRNQLEKYVFKFLPQLDGYILDIGSKNRRYDFLFKTKPKAIDVVENESIDVMFGDINNLSFESESFDSAVCLEVLEYVDTPEKAVGEIARVIKKGGILILSVPFMYKKHDDYMRYTDEYLRKVVLKNFSLIEVFNIGNAYTIILDILKDKINKIKITPLRYLTVLFYLPFALLIEIMGSSKKGVFNSGYIIKAKK